jgi:hypothetical protein
MLAPVSIQVGDRDAASACRALPVWGQRKAAAQTGGFAAGDRPQAGR